MIVCHCNGITDREIRSLVREGRAATIREVSRDCSAGIDCGGCQLAIELIVRAEQKKLACRMPELATAV